MRMLLNGTVLAIEWIDLFDNELGFQVERRVGAGSWEIVESLPAMDRGEGFWSRGINVAASYRVTASVPGRSIPLHSPDNQTEIAIDPAPSNPATIQIDQTEPVRGDLQISLQNAGPASEVIYTIDGAAFARVTSGGTFAATLPAQHLVQGRRELHAFIQKSPGLTLGYRRFLEVDNPAPAVLFFLASTYPQGSTHINARASSAAGITSVEFFINGLSVHVASAPVPTTDQYHYPVDITTLPPGTHVLRVVATDDTNATVAMERTYTVNAAPTLSVIGLFDGLIVSGNSVIVRGEFDDDDDADGANVTIDVGAQRVLRTRNSPFTVDLARAGIPPGEHSVNVRVQDSKGKTTFRYYRIIVPSTSLTYDLLATDAAELLAADRGSLLYRKTSGQVVLRNPAGAEATFSAPGPGDATYYMSEGHIVALGLSLRVYRVDASGQPTEIPVPPDTATFMHAEPAIVRGPWVSWRQAAATPTLRLYDLRTGLSRDVTITDPMSGSQHDIVTASGSEQLLFQGTVNSTPGIHSLNLQTNVTQLLVSGTVAAPSSDGTRLIWSDLASPPTELFIAPLNNPAAATVLGTNVRARTLEGGLACWVDAASTLFVNDGSVTTQLTTQFVQPMTEYTVEDGRIIFPENDRMHVWSATGGKQMWLDALPTSVIQADGVAYFLTDYRGALYRVSLP